MNKKNTKPNIVLYCVLLPLIAFLQFELIAQTIVPQVNHADAISTIKFSSEGEYIASASGNEIKIWQVSTKLLLGTLKAGKSDITRIEFNQSIHLLISANKDSLILWDLVTFQIVKKFPLSGKGAFAVNADWSVAAIHQGGGDIIFIDLTTLERIHQKILPAPADFISFKGTDEVVMLFNQDLQIYDYKKDRVILHRDKFEKKIITHIQVITNSGDIILGLRSSEIEIYKSPAYAAPVKIRTDGNFFDMSINTSEESLAVSLKSKTVDIYNTRNGIKIGSIKSVEDPDNEVQEPIRCFDYSPNSNIVATAGYKIGLFRFSTYNDIAILDVASGKIVSRIGGILNSAERIITNNRNQAVLLAGDQVFLWDFNNGVMLDFKDLQIDELNKEKKGFFKRLDSFFRSSDPALEWIDSTSFIVKYASSKLIRFSIRNKTLVEETERTKGEYFLSAVAFNRADPSRYLIAKIIPDTVVQYYEGDKLISRVNTRTSGDPFSDLEFDSNGRYFVGITVSGKVFWHYMFGSEIASYDKNSSPYLKSFHNFIRIIGDFVVFSVNGSVFKLKTDFFDASPTHYKWYVNAQKLLDCNDCKLTAIDNQTVTVAGSASLFVIDLYTHAVKEIELKNKIVSAGVLADGRILTGADDGGIRYYDASGNKLLDIYVRSANYIFINQNHEYSFSKSGYSLVNYRYKGRLFPFDDFDLQYNRPDRVYSYFRGTSEQKLFLLRKAYEKRMGKSVSADIKSNFEQLPEIVILNKKSIPSVTSQDSLLISCLIQGKNHPLKDFGVLVNGVPVKKVKDLSGTVTYLDAWLMLSAGMNKIQIYASDENGKQSFKNTIFVNRIKENRKPDVYLATISVETYRDTSLNLTYPTEDAFGLYDAFKSSQSYGNVFHLNLSDAMAGPKSLAEISRFLGNAGVDDLAILSYAGHGFLDKDLNLYLGSYEINKNDPTLHGISFNTIEGLFENLACRNRLALIDACHSGDYDALGLQSLINEYSKIRSADSTKLRNAKSNFLNFTDFPAYEMMKELFYNVSSTSGLNIISASAANQYALESKQWKHGAFSLSIIEALTTQIADNNQDGDIRVSELKDYVINRVSFLTSNKQKPTIRDGNVNADFVVRPRN